MHKTSDARPLGVEECRKLLGDTDMSDKEISLFLTDLRAFLERYLDDYFHGEFGMDEEK